MAIIALGRVDKKLLLIVFTFIIRTACLIALYESYGLYENNLINLEEEIGPIIVGIVLHFILKNKQVKQSSTRKSKKSTAPHHSTYFQDIGRTYQAGRASNQSFLP